MKLISWNVNGLRACIQKGFLEHFDRFDADFFCLQETKLSEGQLELELPGYHQYWCYAEKKGYSGTAIFTKHEPLSVHYGLDVEALDNEGRLITLEYPEFFLVTCYTPNAQRGLARIDHRMTWDEAFRAYLQRLDSKKPVILCGDLNVAHKEIDLKNPASNRGNAGFSDQERDSFQKTLDLGFTDTFRHLHPDKTGAYSWWSYMYNARKNNAGWRIDYFLVSDRLKDAIYSADIHSDIMGSDHCPVSVDLGLICNGGIWSPMSQGNSRQLYPAPDEKPSKENAATASAKLAKAFVALSLAAAVLLAMLFLRPEEKPQAPEVELNVTLSAYRLNDSLVMLNDQWVTEGDRSYYVESSLPVDQTNSFVRIDSSTPLLADHLSQMEVSIAFDDGLSHYYKIVPYYQDSHLTVFGGWLVLLNLNEAVHCTMTITYTDQTLTIGFTAKPVTNSPDIEYISDIIYSQVIRNPVYKSDHSDDVAYIYDSNGFSAYTQNFQDITNGALRDISSYNSWFLIKVSSSAANSLVPEEVELTCTAYDENLSKVSSLQLRPIYSDSFCGEFIGWIAYGDLQPDYTVYIRIYKDENMLELEYCYPMPYMDQKTAVSCSTQYLFEFLALHNGLTNDLYSTMTEWTLAQLRTEYPALDELIDRSDAISVLMNYQIDSTMVNTQTAHFILKHYLLDQMTLEEQIDFATFRYPNCPYTNYTMNDEDPYMDRYTPYELLMQAHYLNSVLEQISLCTTEEAAQAVLEYQISVNPYLQKLATIDDAITQLKISCGSDDWYQPFLTAWEALFPERSQMDITTQELINRILADEEICQFIYDRELLLASFGKTEPYLAELASRSDAAQLLLDMDVPADEAIARIPTILLEQMLFNMLTPQQTGQLCTGMYNSCVTEFDFQLNYPTDETAASTEALVEYLETNGDQLYSMLNQAVSWNSENIAAQYEVYQRLLPYSDVLRELETRSDAVDILYLKAMTGNFFCSLSNYLLTVYEQYAITGYYSDGILDASQWREADWDANGFSYAGSYPTLYSYTDFTEQSLDDANFAYFITVPKEYYGNPEYYFNMYFSLGMSTGDTTDKDFIHYRPCYADSEKFNFIGWLIYGYAEADATLYINVSFDGEAMTDCWISVLTGESLIFDVNDIMPDVDIPAEE